MPTYVHINGTKTDDALMGTDPTVQYTINGRKGDDVIVGSALDDVLHGNAGDDYVYGDMQVFIGRTVLPDNVDFVLPLVDLVISLGGNDIITGNADNDHLFGEFDDLDALFQMGNVVASDGQSMTSSVLLSNLHWTFGHDQIDGGAGNDVIYGDHGYFKNEARLGSTTAIGAGSIAASQLLAPTDVKLLWGNDTLHGGAGDDLIYGDYGFMEVTYHSSQAHAIAGGTAISSNVSGGETYSYGHDNIMGGSGNDTIWGDMKYIIINWHGKTAIVEGGGFADANLSLNNYIERFGNDVIHGGEGDDTIYGDLEYELDDLKGGNAFADGGHASANVTYHNATFSMGHDDITGGAGNDKIYADSVMFTLQTTQGISTAINGGTASAIASVENSNVIMGNDLIRGGSGNDVIFADTCKVNLPGDILGSNIINVEGENYLRMFDAHNNGVIWGNDEIRGGSGVDTMVFNLFHTPDNKLGMQGFDTIFNFNKNQDVLSFGDVIDTTGNGLVNLNDLLGATTVQRQGGNTIVNFNGGGSLTFMGTQFNSLADLNVDVSANTVMA